MDNLEIFTKAAVSGVPIVALVLGLVELTKRLGLGGRWLIVVSMGIGLVFGVGYMISQGALRTDDLFAAWFGMIMYGLGLGLVASGIYDVLNTSKTAVK